MKKKITTSALDLTGKLMIVDKIFGHVTNAPLEALKIVFTPENVEAAARGFAQGLKEKNG